jgi:plasmid stabilization system protein ParE
LKQINDIGAHVAHDSPRASAELLARIRSACLLLAEHPSARHRTKARTVRVITMARNPYRIFDEIRSHDQVRILHVRHAAGRPLRRHS